MLLSNIQCYASEGESYAKNYNQTVITGRFIMIQNSIIVILAMMILALSIALALLIRRYARFKNNYDKVIVRDKIRSDYIIIISHEPRTPLNIIVNSAKLLKEYLSNNDKMDKQYVIDKSEYIVNNSSRLLKTINNSIDAAMFEAGLGMYITYNLIKIHGGDMTVESELK
ncbi:histidine kinase dimerization/phospho-acceptor domain-containing protein [Inconstantimicrobium porci]|nr:histidine kinase dimerization/phospho-acceptor domain-containing protein [Inconstantimicrobium porci]